MTALYVQGVIPFLNEGGLIPLPKGLVRMTAMLPPHHEQVI